MGLPSATVCHGQLDVFQFVEDVPPRIQEPSTVLTNWRGSRPSCFAPFVNGGVVFLSPRCTNLCRSSCRDYCCPLTSVGEKSFPWGQKCKHLDQRRQMVRRKSKVIHLCPTRITIFEQRRWTTTLFSLPALSSPPRQLNNHSHLGSPSPSNPREGRL